MGGVWGMTGGATRAAAPACKQASCRKRPFPAVQLCRPAVAAASAGRRGSTGQLHAAPPTVRLPPGCLPLPPACSLDATLGTIAYTAPETFAHNCLKKPSDVYAFGIMRECPPCRLILTGTLFCHCSLGRTPPNSARLCGMLHWWAVAGGRRFHAATALMGTLPYPASPPCPTRPLLQCGRCFIAATRMRA